MPMNRAQFAKQLEPGLNTLFGLEYKQYPEQWAAVFGRETSEKAFEEDTLLTGFGTAPTKAEGAAVSYDSSSEAWTARYVHETIALAFAITEEAEEDGLYGSIAKKYTKALARSMAHTKEVKAANILNNGFSSSYTGGDGKELFATDHPIQGGGTQQNELTTAADLNETSLEDVLILISEMKDDREIPIAARGMCLVIPPALQFTAERLLASNLRPGTGDNDVNAMRSMGMLPDGMCVMQRLTDADAWFVKTDVPDGLKYFERVAMKTGMEGDFETGNVRYKCRERYSFGWTDWRGMFASPGA